LAMTFCSLLPASTLPPTGYPAKQELCWLFDDNQENYQRNKGHPLYGEKDIIYRFNSLGYRCPEFDTAADIRVIAIGCSFVMGHALPQSALFHEIFAQKLRAELGKTVVVWNLGRCGASNDYMSRLLYLAVPRLKPHIVIINFTRSVRREYVSVQNRGISYNPSFVPSDEVTKDIFHHIAALSSPFDDQLNLFKNYKAIECLLAGQFWIYSHISPNEIEPITHHFDRMRYAGPLQTIDRARDHGHPGPESHRRLAELYWAKFIEMNGREQIASKIA
jgi:hypothetical protein